jgi:pimeloyl-ACP methyl ester carboxylesterase
VSERDLERDGVRIGHRAAGSGDRTLLLPAWQIVDSRIRDAQVATLADAGRVIPDDARGSGRSSRPRDPGAYAAREVLADAVAALDATGTGRAVVVGSGRGPRPGTGADRPLTRPPIRPPPDHHRPPRAGRSVADAGPSAAPHGNRSNS